VVVGGGIVEELKGFIWPRLKEAMKAHSFCGEVLVDQVVPAQLGDDCVAIGVASFAKHQNPKE
jgi:hypothetical protein